MGKHICHLGSLVPVGRRGAPVIPAALGCQLTQALFGFFVVRGYWQDGLQANQTALELARRTGDRPAQADAHNHVGLFYQRLGRYEEAIAHGEAEAVRDLGDALRATDRNSEAEAGWREALTICEALEIPEANEIRDRLATLPSQIAD